MTSQARRRKPFEKEQDQDREDHEEKERLLDTTRAALLPKKPKIPWQPVITAWGLFIVGSVFGFMGLNKLIADGVSEAISFLAIAGICLIPGAFYVVVFILAFLGYEGYSYDMIPHTQD